MNRIIMTSPDAETLPPTKENGNPDVMTLLELANKCAPDKVPRETFAKIVDPLLNANGIAAETGEDPFLNPNWSV